MRFKLININVESVSSMRVTNDRSKVQNAHHKICTITIPHEQVAELLSPVSLY